MALPRTTRSSTTFLNNYISTSVAPGAAPSSVAPISSSIGGSMAGFGTYGSKPPATAVSKPTTTAVKQTTTIGTVPGVAPGSVAPISSSIGGSMAGFGTYGSKPPTISAAKPTAPKPTSTFRGR